LSEIIQTGLEVQVSPPYIAQIKNEWSYSSTHPTYFHDVDSSSFTFCTENDLQALIVSLSSHHEDMHENATLFGFSKQKKLRKLRAEREREMMCVTKGGSE